MRLWNFSEARNEEDRVVYRMGLVDSAICLRQEVLRHDPDNLQIKKNLDYARKSQNR